MAVFEKEYKKRKVYLDDTHPLVCSFTNVQNIHGHIVSAMKIINLKLCFLGRIFLVWLEKHLIALHTFMNFFFVLKAPAVFCYLT